MLVARAQGLRALARPLNASTRTFGATFSRACASAAKVRRPGDRAHGRRALTACRARGSAAERGNARVSQGSGTWLRERIRERRVCGGGARREAVQDDQGDHQRVTGGGGAAAPLWCATLALTLRRHIARRHAAPPPRRRRQDDVHVVDRIPQAEVGTVMTLDKVLLVGTTDYTTVGRPLVSEAKVGGGTGGGALLVGCRAEASPSAPGRGGCRAAHT